MGSVSKDKRNTDKCSSQLARQFEEVATTQNIQQISCIMYVWFEYATLSQYRSYISI